MAVVVLIASAFLNPMFNTLETNSLISVVDLPLEAVWYTTQVVIDIGFHKTRNGKSRKQPPWVMRGRV